MERFGNSKDAFGGPVLSVCRAVERDDHPRAHAAGCAFRSRRMSVIVSRERRAGHEFQWHGGGAVCEVGRRNNKG